MVSNIFIIHESGLCLFSRDYEGNSQKVDLFSGLLSAFSSFARVLIGEEVHEIHLEQHRIFYEVTDTLILALITPDTRISKKRLSSAMKKICQTFLDSYHEYLEEEIFEPQLYKNFTNTVDEILKSRGVIKKVALSTNSLESRKPTILLEEQLN
ncbi:MAG: hypothetical protein ACXAB2_14330 [Candidatus Hodarchaeales archaeon]|jgi:hypothetical protein